MLRSAMLFYKKFTSCLIHIGFELSPDDKCLANQMVNGSQMMVIWHVDNLKILHADPKEVMKVEECLKWIYGKVNMTRVKAHEYLGVTADYQIKVEVHISMIKYVIDMIKKFPEENRSKATTPTVDHFSKQ